jgi:hypothetical protein
MEYFEMREKADFASSNATSRYSRQEIKETRQKFQWR